MHKLAGRETLTDYSSEALTIRGATIETPPPLEDRLYTVPDNVDAYTPPTSGRIRMPTEIAQVCLSGVGEMPVFPDLGNQNIFRLRRDLGALACSSIDGALASSNPTGLSKAIRALPFVYPSKKRLEVALNVMNGEDVGSYPKAIALHTIRAASKLDTIELVRENEAGVDPVVVARAANRDIVHISRPPQSRLFAEVEKLKARLSPNFLVDSPLHAQAGDDIKPFEKTGTETYILPKNYEASVRIIPVSAAAAWLNAFQNWPEWYRRGFNYVPVEPIEDFAQTDDAGMVAVTTTNLRGKSLRSVFKHMTEYQDQLIEMREQIREALTKMCIGHHHLHDGNFVVVPYRDENDKVDLSRCPRLYVIDFDDAEPIIKI